MKIEFIKQKDYTECRNVIIEHIPSGDIFFVFELNNVLYCMCDKYSDIKIFSSSWNTISDFMKSCYDKEYRICENYKMEITV